MKKVIFMALAGVFMVSSGFTDYSSTTNKVGQEYQPDYLCHYSITQTTIYPGDFNVYQDTNHFYTITDSEFACQGAANLHLWGLQLGVIDW